MKQVLSWHIPNHKSACISKSANQRIGLVESFHCQVAFALANLQDLQDVTYTELKYFHLFITLPAKIPSLGQDESRKFAIIILAVYALLSFFFSIKGTLENKFVVSQHKALSKENFLYMRWHFCYVAMPFQKLPGIMKDVMSSWFVNF